MSSSRLIVWGNNNQNLLSDTPLQCLTKPEEIAFPYSILKITATEKHVSFITNKSQVYSYGSNSDGRLGVQQKDNFKCSYQNPVKVNLNNMKAKNIQAGFSHVLLQTQNNQIFSWGLGEYGALGIGQFRTKYTPTKVLVPNNIKKISCGAMHTAFLDNLGALYMCGSNQYGELGIRGNDKIGTPILLPFLHRIKSVACGVFYTLLLTQKGEVYGMGNNKYAQLGLGHKINENVPTLIQELTNITIIEAGYHSGAVNQSHQLFLWGSGSFGQLLRPRKFILQSRITSLQIRGFFGLAISQSENKFYIWGNNTHGELGNGGYISQKTPTQMKQLSNKKIKDIFCGVSFALVILQPANVQIHQKHEYSYSPINNFSSRKKHGQYSLQGSPHQNKQSKYQHNENYPVKSSRGHAYNYYLNQLSQLNKLSQLNQLNDLNQYKDEHKYSTIIPKIDPNISSYPNQAYGQVRQNLLLSQIPLQPIGSQIRRSYERNYEELFKTLSKDYEVLATRYHQLQLQIEQREIKRSKQQEFISESKEQFLFKENTQLRDQIYFLQKQLITTKEQQAISLDRIISLENQLQSCSLKLESYLNESPIRKNKIVENNLMLQEKEKFIHELEARIHMLESTLQEENKYNEEIKIKYKKLLEELGQSKLENQTLKEMLMKSQYNLHRYEGNLKNILTGQQHEFLSTQLIQFKRKVQQLQEKSFTSEKLLQNQKATVLALQEERKKLYETLDAVKSSQHQFKLIKQKKIEEQQQKIQSLQNQVKSLLSQMNLDKDFMGKLQQKSTQMDRLRGQSCRQLQKMSQNYEKQKKRRKELQRQIERLKSSENELKITKQQLSKQRELGQDYRDKVQKQYKKKQHLIKEMQEQIKSKQNEFEQILSKREQQIKILEEQIHSKNTKLQTQKINIKKLNKQISLRIDDIDNLQSQITKFERKQKHSKEQMQKQLVEKEDLIQEMGSLRREKTKQQLQKQQNQKRIYELQRKISEIENNRRREKQQITQLQKQLQNQTNKILALKQQNTFMRSELNMANNAVEQSNKVSEELSKANRQFSQNQEQLNKRISDLQAQVYQLQDQNRSYTPRYDALIEKNRQLQDRNKELSEMVNKAIEIQAEKFRSNILKEVQVSSNHIIDEVQDEKRFKQRFNRKVQERDDLSEQLHQENQSNCFTRTPDVVSRVKQEPYTKYMNEKIETHRRRVSESANKLAGILDLDNDIGSGFSRGHQQTLIKKNDDEQYEKINNQMQSLKNQKQAFMQKINSFASKMKLL